MASGTIVAESLRTAGREGKLVREHAFNPRSSNGRTAAFGAVNRGSNPCRGAKHSVVDNSGLATRPNRPVRIPSGPAPGKWKGLSVKALRLILLDNLFQRFYRHGKGPGVHHR